MNRKQQKTNKGPFCLGSDAEQTTFVFGDPEGHIRSVIVEPGKQFAPNDFAAALYRFGEINKLRNEDFQKAIFEIFCNEENSA